MPGVERAVDAEEGLLILARQRDGLLSEILGTLGDLDTNLVDLKVRDAGLALSLIHISPRLPPPR